MLRASAVLRRRLAPRRPELFFAPPLLRDAPLLVDDDRLPDLAVRDDEPLPELALSVLVAALLLSVLAMTSSLSETGMKRLVMAAQRPFPSKVPGKLPGGTPVATGRSPAMLNDPIKFGLPPVARRDARILILGSLPGDASLAARQYYAHPRNHFWQLLGAILNEPLGAMAYPARIERLRKRRIALWDMVAQAKRPGSLDQALSVHSLQNVAGLAATLPNLRMIAFNGVKASVLGKGLILPDAIARITLPSSSAANTQPIPEKLRRWQHIGDFL